MPFITIGDTFYATATCSGTGTRRTHQWAFRRQDIGGMALHDDSLVEIMIPALGECVCHAKGRLHMIGDRGQIETLLVWYTYNVTPPPEIIAMPGDVLTIQAAYDAFVAERRRI